MPRTLLARPGPSHTSPRTNSVRPPMRSRPHVLPRPKARARPQGDSSANGSVTSSRRRFASSCLTTSAFLDEVGLQGCGDFVGRLQRVVDGPIPCSVVNHRVSIAPPRVSGSRELTRQTASRRPVMPHGANLSNSSVTLPSGGRAGQAGADGAFAMAAVTSTARRPPSARRPSRACGPAAQYLARPRWIYADGRVSARSQRAGRSRDDSDREAR